MAEMTDREIEQRLKEALAELEEGLGEDDEDVDLTLDPSPTIEDVKHAMYQLRVTATLIRQHAERQKLHAQHLEERLQPIRSEDVRELVADDPESAAAILYWVRVLGVGPLAAADRVADDVGAIAERVGFFGMALQGRTTKGRSSV